MDTPTASNRHVLFFICVTSSSSHYSLSLHDALPICGGDRADRSPAARAGPHPRRRDRVLARLPRRALLDRRARRLRRSEEHTSELQSRLHLVCRLLLEKKKRQKLERFIL